MPNFFDHIDPNDAVKHFQRFYQEKYETDHKIYSLKELIDFLIKITKHKNAVTKKNDYFASHSHSKSEPIKIPDEILEVFATLFQQNIEINPGFIPNEGIWFAMSCPKDRVIWSYKSLLKEFGSAAKTEKPKRKFNRYTALIDDRDKE